MPFGNTKKIFKRIFSVLSQFKKYHLSGNLKLNNTGISQSLKSRIFKKTILPISLKLNFTPNTLGFYGLNLTESVNLATLHGRADDLRGSA